MASSAAAVVLAPPEDDVELTEMALSLLQILVDVVSDLVDDSSTTSEMLHAPLQAIVYSVTGLAPASLFSEWSPRSDVHEMPLAVDETSPVADSVRSDSSNATRFAATNALDRSRSYWASDSGKKVSLWTARLVEPSEVTSVTLTWAAAEGKRGAPATVEVLVSDDGSVWTLANTVQLVEAIPALKSAGTLPGGEAALTHRVPLPVGVTQFIRLQMTGAVVNSVGYHGLSSFVANTRDTAHLHTDTRSTLSALERLLHRTAVGKASTPAIARLAVRGLQGLSLASGSVNGALRLMEVLLAGASCITDGKDLAPELAHELRDYIPRVAAVMDQELERSLSGGDFDATAKFDPECKSSNISLSEDDTVLTSRQSNKNHVYGTVGFSSGKAAWEFQCLRDSNGDECACYGCGIKPVTSSSYDSSSNLWMVRGYNGSIYQPGGGGGSSTKLHQGDLVRFELDCDAGTCKLIVNGVDRGIVFRGLENKEVFPAICTYGDNRVVKFVKLECDSMGGDDVTFCSKLDEQSSTGHFYKAGRLNADSDISLGGKGKGNAVSLMPYSSTNEPASVTYTLSDVSAEFLLGSVTVDDSSPLEARAVTFEVLGVGEELLYASVPVASHGDTCFFRVYLGTPGTHPEVTLRARVTDTGGDPAVPCASTVLINPRFVSPREWGWLPGGPGRPRPVLTSSTPPTMVKAILQSFSGLVSAQMHAMSSAALAAARSEANLKDPSDAAAAAVLQHLEVPFCIDVCAETFVRLQQVLDQVLPMVAAEHREASESKYPEGGEPPYSSIATDLLSVVTANLRRLVLSKVSPGAVGINITSDGGEPLTLGPLHNTLEAIMNAEDEYPAKLRVMAAAAVDAGLSVLYPTSKELRQLLTSLLAKGAVVEVQFHFPAMVAAGGDKDGDGEEVHDTRFDRCLVLLQVECEARGFECRLEGKWGSQLHLIVGLPAADPATTVELLDTGFQQAFTRAGFSGWAIPMGCSDPMVPLKIERYAEFEATRNDLDAGVGIVRIFPHSAGSFDDVHKGIVESMPSA